MYKITITIESEFELSFRESQEIADFLSDKGFENFAYAEYEIGEGK